MWKNKIITVMMLCFLQVAVPAWGVFLCVCKDGHIAEEMTGIAFETPDDICEPRGDGGFCVCCASEGASCDGTLVSPFLLSSRSPLQPTPDSQSGGSASAEVDSYAAPASAADPSGYFRNLLHIESATQLSISTIVLLI